MASRDDATELPRVCLLISMKEQSPCNTVLMARQSWCAQGAMIACASVYMTRI